MLTLPRIFSSGALFLQCARLTLHGLTEPKLPVRAAVTDKHGNTVSTARTVADKDGAFSLTVQSPPASLMHYTITVTAGSDSHVMEDVLFGELWLASGQSNMELENQKQPQTAEFLSALTGKQIRVYHVYNIDGGNEGLFPEEPEDTADGGWCALDDSDSLGAVSALGTAFANEVYEHLRRVGPETPVGFVNACWGGTGIHSWLPKTAVDADTALAARLRGCGLYDDDPDKWNTRGRENAQQMSCQYNLKIHCLRGLSFRGMLWYQGEFESWDEPYRRTYLDCLYLLHRTYRALFADGDRFPMLCMLIFPFPCTDGGDCLIGYVNKNFVDATSAYPDDFHIIPTYDLPPVWQPGDHPIHPLHKYTLGKRLGKLTLSVAYGCDGMTNPAVLDRFETDGDRLLLHFSVPGQPNMLHRVGGIRVGEAVMSDSPRITHPVGLYISGEDGTYVPAFCETVSPDTLAVFHPGTAHPVHALYACSSMEADCNLWAGTLPAAPFMTDYGGREDDRERRLITVECKPWCDTSRSAVWTPENTDGIFDVFYRPIWKPTEDCEVTHDRAFTLEGGSIRIARTLPDGEHCTVGAYVAAHPYNRLDLQNYRALRCRMLCVGNAALSVILTCQSEDGTAYPVTLAAERTAVLSCGWAEYEIPLDGIPDDEIVRMTLSAVLSDTRYQFVNMEGFVLIPKPARPQKPYRT